MKEHESEKDRKPKNKSAVLIYVSIVVLGFVAVFFFVSRFRFDFFSFVWVLIGLILLIADVTILSTYILFPFGIGCICTAIARSFGISLLAQIFVFLCAASVVFVLFIFEKRGRASTLNGENIEGSYGKVTVEINPPIKGRVYLNGNTWAALSETKIEKGKKILVKKIEGITIFVEEVQE